MKFPFCLLNSLLLLSSLTYMSACSDKKDSPQLPDDNQKELKIISASPAEGSIVTPDEELTVTFTYSDAIEIVHPSDIVVNGSPAGVSAAADRRELKVTFLPQPDLTYEIHIDKYAVKIPGISVFGQDFTLTLTSGPRPTPPSDIAPLTNPNASAEARRVYDFLKANYGKKILSGAMANVANNNDFADWIHKVSGKYPALTCYDFIHLPSSPANWIDYSDITPAKTQWEAGGLVAYMWHWLTSDTQGGELSYNSNFDISAALTPGTWQNAQVMADIDKVAGYLTKLRDAGIPVIWRPLHEAAGDKSWGAWFWWGRQGAEPCRKLWRLLHDTLTNQYGLNNLIWVWTAQTSDQGSIADLAWLKEWYPGDDVVDIIGADIYEKSSSSWADRFQLINSLGQGKKIVTLAETGLLPDIAACEADKAMWSWAMLWYTHDAHKTNPGTDEFGNTQAAIKAWMQNSAVLCRGDFKL